MTRDNQQRDKTPTEREVTTSPWCDGALIELSARAKPRTRERKKNWINRRRRPSHHHRAISKVIVITAAALCSKVVVCERTSFWSAFLVRLGLLLKREDLRRKDIDRRSKQASN